MRNFETYCKDYEKAKKDDFKGWCCHHRKGEFIPMFFTKQVSLYL